MNQYNDKYEPHGYWECYHYDRILWYKGNYVNGERNGYWEWYDYKCNLQDKQFYL
jgi:hypothetical protein